MDIDAHWPAFLAVAIVLLILVVVLYYRAKSDDEILTKKDIAQNTLILVLIAKKLGVTDGEIELARKGIKV